MTETQKDKADRFDYSVMAMLPVKKYDYDVEVKPDVNGENIKTTIIVRVPQSTQAAYLTELLVNIDMVYDMLLTYFPFDNNLEQRNIQFGLSQFGYQHVIFSVIV